MGLALSRISHRALRIKTFLFTIQGVEFESLDIHRRQRAAYEKKRANKKEKTGWEKRLKGPETAVGNLKSIKKP